MGLVYTEVAPKLRAYLRRASGNAALADNIVRETFIDFSEPICRR